MAALREERITTAEKRAKRRVVRSLHEAILANKVTSVISLMTPELDVNFHYGGHSALQLAVTNGLTDMCSILISHGADVNKYDAEENTLLNMACWRGNHNVAKLLVENGADVDRANNRGATPINICAYKGYTKIAKLLVHNDCDINRPNERSQSPLMTCACVGHVGVAKVLIDGGCDLEYRDWERRTPLIVASENGHVDLIKLLCDSGCDVNAREQYGRTAVFFAACKGNTDVVQALVKAGADINITDTKSCTPLLEAVKNSHMDVVNILIRSGCDLNRAERENQQTPLHHAVRQVCYVFGSDESNYLLVRMLLEAHCDINLKDKSGWTTLFQSAFAGENVLVKTFLDAGADVTVVTENGDSLLHGAVYGNQTTIVQKLIKAGCNVNCVNKKNELPLFTAIDHRANIEIIRLLIEAGSDVDVQENTENMSPLCIAIKHDYAEAVQLLIKAGCNVNVADREGDTPLCIACDKGNEQIVAALLQHPDIDVDAGLTHVPLLAAATRGYTAIVEMLLCAGCNTDRMNRFGSTAIQLAVDMNNINIAKLLIKWGCNPAAYRDLPKGGRCCKNFTDVHPHLELEPLYYAVQNDNFMLIKLLMYAHYQPYYADIRTLRDLVFRTGYAQQVGLDSRIILHYAEFFTTVLSRPSPLKALCRGAVRKGVGQCPFEKVDKLPLPSDLKKYVLLQNVVK